MHTCRTSFICAYTYAHSHAQSHTCTLIHTPTHTVMHTYARSHACTHTHTHRHTVIYVHMHSDIHAHLYIHSHSHSNTHAHSHTCAHHRVPLATLTRLTRKITVTITSGRPSRSPSSFMFLIKGSYIHFTPTKMLHKTLGNSSAQGHTANRG